MRNICWIIAVRPAWSAVKRSGDVIWVNWRDVIAAAAAAGKDKYNCSRHNRRSSLLWSVVEAETMFCFHALVRSGLVARSCENCRPIITVPTANNARRRTQAAAVASASPPSLWFATTIVAADASLLLSENCESRKYQLISGAWHRFRWVKLRGTVETLIN